MPVTSSIPGFTYAKLHELKAGDRITVDGGFTCCKQGQQFTLKSDNDTDGLYFNCGSGKHYLVGQLGRDEQALTVIGVTKIETKS